MGMLPPHTHTHTAPATSTHMHTHELHTVHPACGKPCLAAFRADLGADAEILARPHHCAGPVHPHLSLPCWGVCVSASASSSPTQSVPGRVARLHHCSSQTLRWQDSKPLTVDAWALTFHLEALSLSSLLSWGFSHCTSHKASSSQSRVPWLGLAVPVPLPGIHWDLRIFALLEIPFLFTGKAFLAT